MLLLSLDIFRVHIISQLKETGIFFLLKEIIFKKYKNGVDVAFKYYPVCLVLTSLHWNFNYLRTLILPSLGLIKR